MQEQSIALADVQHTNTAHLIVSKAVPNQDLQWNYNTTGDILATVQFTTFPLSDLCKPTLKPVNCKKLLGDHPGHTRNPASIFTVPYKVPVTVY